MFKQLLFFISLSTVAFSSPTIFVGIAGGSGAGKTTMAQRIHQALPDAILINQDSYYHDLSDLPREERMKVNFDHPDAIDFALLKQHLIDLADGQSIAQPIYDFSQDTRTGNTQTIQPASIVIVEGIFVLAIKEIRELLDVKIFIDTDADLRVLRRIARDIKERGRDFDSSKERYLSNSKSMHEIFVEPSKRYADLIVPQNSNSRIATNLICSMLSYDAEKSIARRS